MSRYRDLRDRALAHDHTRNLGGRPIGSHVDPAIRDARYREQRRRGVMAGLRAKSALAKAYPNVYRELYLAAKAEVDRERGPLPGDER